MENNYINRKKEEGGGQDGEVGTEEEGGRNRERNGRGRKPEQERERKWKGNG